MSNGLVVGWSTVFGIKTPLGSEFFNMGSTIMAKTSPVINSTTWNVSGGAISAPVELVQDDALGIIGMTCTGATGSGVARRVENPDKRPPSGSDFDHVILLDMVTSSVFPWFAGMYVENSATQKLSAFGFFSSGKLYRQRWTDTAWNSEDNIGAAIDVAAGGTPISFYMRLRRIGANLDVMISGSGLGWITVHTEILSEHLIDIDRVGLFFNPQSQSSADASGVFVLGHDDTGPQPRG